MTGPRDLPEALESEIAKAGLRPFVALHIDFPDPVRAFTGKGRFPYAGHEWQGIEGIGQISAIEQGIDGAAKGYRASLYKVPAEYEGDIADQAVRHCLFEIYLGVFDPRFSSVLALQRLWKGSLQGFEVVDSGADLSVTVTGETRSINQRRPAIKTFTDEWQQRKYAGDRVFEYAARMAEVPIVWAKAKQDPL